MHCRNRWGSGTHCAFGQPDSVGDVRQDLVLPRKKRFSWQQPSSPTSEAPLFAPKRPLLGSVQKSVTAMPVGNLTAFPPACLIKPYIGAPGTVHQALLSCTADAGRWLRLARIAASHSSTRGFEVCQGRRASRKDGELLRSTSACKANPHDPSLPFSWTSWPRIPGVSSAQQPPGSSLCGSCAFGCIEDVPSF